MEGIREEIVAFLVAVIAGSIVRSGYQCITSFRNVIPHRMFWVEVEDILFWTGTGVYLFVQIYHTSNGSVRWYFILGVVFGVLGSTIFLRKIKKVLKKIYDFHFGQSVAKNPKKRYDNKY